MGADIKTDNLAEYTLTLENFPTFYRRILTMRFPIPVEDVLELRDLLNHSSETFETPPDNPQYREFQDSLLAAIHSFGIENERHCLRLLNMLAMFRSLHYQHSIDTRNTEEKLRLQQDVNRQARSHSVRYGLFALMATITTGLVWIGLNEAPWWLKLGTAGLALLTWDYHRSLPTLDKEMARITHLLNEVMRNRVDSLNWKTLIHKLALVLGYKQIRGVEVFRHNHESTNNEHNSRIYH